MYQVQKWGNSLGIRIPAALAKQIGLSEGTPIDLEVSEDKIVVRKKKYDLQSLLAEVTEDNIHKEIDTGKAVGKEIW